MYRLSGLRNICSTDASQTVIERMRERAAARCPGITWAVADLLALPFADASFDVVIEKGVIDCFMVRVCSSCRRRRRRLPVALLSSHSCTLAAG